MYQKAEENPHNRGRKGHWKPQMVAQTFKLALLGATDKQIADFFGIATCVLSYWKQHNKEFTDALKRGKIEADSKVANALYRRAIGYIHPDVHIMSNRVAVYDQITGKVVEEHTEPLIVHIKKYYPPDSFACIKWLGLRQKENWTDIQNVSVKYSGDIKIDINQISDALSDKKLISTDEIRFALKYGVLNKAKEVVDSPQLN